MASHDATTGQVVVFTYKEGLFSALAHDLKIEVTRFTIEASEEGAITGEIDAGSLRVVSAMKEGVEAPDLLDVSKHRAEIEKNLAEVLATARFARITFEGRAEGDAIVGRLTLHGATREIRGARRQEGGRVIADFPINQADFGIKPFSAMLGALKVKPGVVVRVSLPLAP